jgi:hypothetical protein
MLTRTFSADLSIEKLTDPPGDRRRIALDEHPLAPRALPGGQLDVLTRDTQLPGQQFDDGGVGLAILRSLAHGNLHGIAVHAAQRLAARPGLRMDVDVHAVGRGGQGRIRIRHRQVSRRIAMRCRLGTRNPSRK